MSLFLPRIDAQEIHTGTLSCALPETLPRVLQFAEDTRLAA